MTALSGPILFNNSTGSDTAASGCGPATAISVMLQTSAGSNVANASWSGTINPGDLMYVPGITGRKFNVVQSATPTTNSITFDDNWDASSSSTAGYVGGKRATFDNADSRLIFSYGLSATIETETDQTINSIIYLGQNTGNIVKGSNGSQVITGTHNDAHFWGKNFVLADMTFATTNSTNTATAAYKNYNNNNTMHAINLTIDGMSLGANGVGTGLYHFWVRCKATNLSGYAINRSTGNMYASMSRCYVDSAAGAANWGGGTNIGCTITNSVFANCTGSVLAASQVSARTEIIGNVFVNNAGNCVNFDFNSQKTTIANNIFASNTGYAINSTVDPSVVPDVHLNAYYSNTAGNTSTGSVESSAITLTADPFVDAANGDFNISDSAGGGATLRSTNYTLGG